MVTKRQVWRPGGLLSVEISSDFQEVYGKRGMALLISGLLSAVINFEFSGSKEKVKYGTLNWRVIKEEISSNFQEVHGKRGMAQPDLCESLG